MSAEEVVEGEKRQPTLTQSIRNLAVAIATAAGDPSVSSETLLPLSHELSDLLSQRDQQEKNLKEGVDKPSE